jgi:hypothetical protein
MASRGVGVQEGDGSGVPTLFLGPAVKCKRQGSGGRGRHCGVKRASLPLPPYLYRGTRVMGIMVSAPLPRPFLRKSPRGSTEWGGDSCNRATRQ